MKRLVYVILAAALLWSGYWVVGAIGAKRGLNAWFDARRAEGWVAEHSDFTLRGFPNRFDATWRDMTLADPDTGLAWELPIFQLLALSYRPTHVIAVWPREMQVATPQAKLPVTNDDLRASLRLEAGTELALIQSNLVASNLAVQTNDPARMDNLRLALARRGDTGSTYRLGVQADGVSPPAALVRRMAGGVALPDAVQEVKIDADVTFDKPWDISALEVARPQPQRIALSLARAEWGRLALQATGTLDIDARGLPSGDLDVQARNWQDMLRVAVSAGALSEGAARSAESALGLMARLKGNPNTLDVTLSFRDGMVTFGPIPLGPAPVLRLR
ncbi:DUF2125 domain-containing protein [Pseudooceanicola aestuarii]|uniref:DUF2125 domain-containing protein n=1 Tax=Pseudooceanicola aestuarii TaxID=2697319 RepID=UPI001EF99459|nr:DUF2125 domain-containing protein [Pseudooceanicola aestuarii]